MKKKQLSVVAAIVMCLSILASGTIAYFTAEDRVHNVITSSGVDIAIKEWQEIDGDLVEYPDDPVETMPGNSVSKVVTIENLDADAYIRARIEVVVELADGTKITDPAALKGIIDVTVESEKWLQKDGDAVWYYYGEAVEKGESTEALISEVVFSGPNMGNEYQNATITVTVYAQAVQVANNGASALKAAGWPAE